MGRHGACWQWLYKFRSTVPVLLYVFSVHGSIMILARPPQAWLYIRALRSGCNDRARVAWQLCTMSFYPKADFTSTHCAKGVTLSLGWNDYHIRSGNRRHNLSGVHNVLCMCMLELNGLHCHFGSSLRARIDMSLKTLPPLTHKTSAGINEMSLLTYCLWHVFRSNFLSSQCGTWRVCSVSVS